jgi:hypothetical protein
VNLIVHGTVQGSSDNLRITVNLENLAEGRHWSQEFTGVAGDLLTLEDQIFAKLVDAMEAKPTDKEMAAVTAHPTENIEAYNLYLKGRNALAGTPDQKTLQAGMNFFEGALQKDPSFALAYAGLADDVHPEERQILVGTRGGRREKGRATERQTAGGTFCPRQRLRYHRANGASHRRGQTRAGTGAQFG